MTKIDRALSAEFLLLTHCCRWPRPAAVEAATAGASAAVDWPHVLKLARRHRVEGLVWRALSNAAVELPREAAAELAAAAARIARQNLRAAAESVRLTRALDRAGLPHLFVKGVTLGKLVYGDISLKAGWDIDLLVGREQLGSAAALLESAGYALAIPEPGRRGQLEQWHDHSKESLWRSADGAVWVELHTALSDNPLLLGGVGLGSPLRRVEIAGGMSLPTLEHDELFAYLCAHGASSAWFRLKWIADLAALISEADSGEIERLYRRSVALGAGRTAALALLLAATLFGTRLGAELTRELRSDRVNGWLVSAALRKLTGRTGSVELHEVTLGTASIHLTQLALMRPWRFKRVELGRQLVSPRDILAVPLPRWLYFLYPLMRAARLFHSRPAE